MLLHVLNISLKIDKQGVWDKSKGVRFILDSRFKNRIELLEVELWK